MKIRKKCRVIEAVQWLNKKIVCPPGPEWFAEAEESGVITLCGDVLYIRTPERDVRANVGDWIVRDEYERLYAYKPDFFESSFEAVDVDAVELQRERDNYKLSYDKAINAVDAVFQVDSSKPPPLLPNFLKLGDCKFVGIVKLAQAYKQTSERLANAEQTICSALYWLQQYKNDADNATHAKRMLDNYRVLVMGAVGKNPRS